MSAVADEGGGYARPALVSHRYPRSTSTLAKCDKLELHVVGVAEVQRRAPVVVTDRAVLDALVGHACFPLLQGGAVGHREADMVKPGPARIEGLPAVRGVGGEADAHGPVRSAEEDRPASGSTEVL